jgi:signal transduction histidine kinase
MPFLPFLPGPADALMGVLGAGCGVAGFFAYVLRAAYYNANMVNGLRVANAQAKERQAEAEAKRAEAEAANRAKSEFLAVMTHELRTPLNAVIGYAEIIEEDMNAEGRAELAGDAARITGSARHLLKLIDQILSMASIDAGQAEFSPRDVDVRKLVDDAVKVIQDDADAGGNRISVRVAPDAERAFSDPDKLAICITALLSNAVKFTSNGLIAVTIERTLQDDHVWLSLAVSDTGIGIAAEDMARVFAPFTQIDGSATRAKGGMGLGLSIVQRMARALGGELTVTSEIGVGSTFTLLTPQLSAPVELVGESERVAA